MGLVTLSPVCAIPGLILLDRKPLIQDKNIVELRDQWMCYDRWFMPEKMFGKDYFILFSGTQCISISILDITLQGRWREAPNFDYFDAYRFDRSTQIC